MWFDVIEAILAVVGVGAIGAVIWIILHGNVQ